jgi:hypothetical protein
MFNRTKMNMNIDFILIFTFALQLSHLFVLNNGHIDSYTGLL